MTMHLHPNNKTDDRSTAPQDAQITITHAKLAQLMKLFAGTEPGVEITLALGDGHSGHGHYAYLTEHSEAGSVCLDATTLPPDHHQSQGRVWHEPIGVTEAMIHAALAAVSPLYEEHLRHPKNGPRTAAAAEADIARARKMITAALAAAHRHAAINDDPPHPVFIATAPERIYLDVGHDVAHLPATVRFDDLGDVSWSVDNATGHGIEYVRIDRATLTDSSPPSIQGAVEGPERSATVPAVATTRSSCVGMK